MWYTKHTRVSCVVYVTWLVCFLYHIEITWLSWKHTHLVWCIFSMSHDYYADFWKSISNPAQDNHPPSFFSNSESQHSTQNCYITWLLCWLLRIVTSSAVTGRSPRTVAVTVIAVCCSVLQRVAVCLINLHCCCDGNCSVLQRVAACSTTLPHCCC